ncbi:hypothetical protein E2F46_02665 [Luteimonas aestuarii]|uniref:Peptidase S8/S53 domain-containing protein n=1 Tax=Luteimonas aestuarii TaxID=453837 RepID=A0A4R5U0R5_9GAMM|nr:S8 family serine peptidase [Luteimonas aestuarii]TDK27134.1 hypothetical protein E2F46_02665 [Luteimonas aestuarii]
MIRMCLMLVLAVAGMMGSKGLAAPPGDADAAPRVVVRTQAELPSSSFPLDRKPSELLSDEEAFHELARRVSADIEQTLATHDIQDAAAQGTLYATLRDLALLRGDASAARDYNARLRALQTKPSEQWITGLRHAAYADAIERGSDASLRDEAIRKHMAEALEPMPWGVVRNDIREMRNGIDVLNANIIAGIVASRIDPVQQASGALSRELFAQLANFKVALDFMVPHAAAQLAALDAYIAANHVRKPNIWLDRDISLYGREDLSPVIVGIWDSGVDTSLFPGQLHVDAAARAEGRLDEMHGIAFDIHSNRESGLLLPLSPEQRESEDMLYQHLKGSLDSQYQIDSPEADAFRAHVAGLSPDDIGPFMEGTMLYFNYVHGTHVAGVALQGNPAARLLVARDTFPSEFPPPPFTRERVEANARMYREIVDYLKSQGVRVVNLSWIWSPLDIERSLEAHGLGGTPEQRRAEAIALFVIVSEALTEAIRSAPDILFVPAAGNSDEDVDFIQAIPAGIDLPNVLTAGAVDQAGDETGFTSHGRLVRVHANGYEVDGPVPGGRRMHWHGTSLAAPQVTNLAAKLFALVPTLSVAEVVQLILDGAERSDDGRRNLINPRRSLELLAQRRE